MTRRTANNQHLVIWATGEARRRRQDHDAGPDGESPGSAALGFTLRRRVVPSMAAWDGVRHDAVPAGRRRYY